MSLECTVSSTLTRHHARTKFADIALILSVATLLGFLSQVRIQLPFTPVPITLQAQAALLIGALLGPRKGAATILSYITMGVMGMPFFAGGTFGPAVLLGPSGGYLVGMCVGSFITGSLCERGLNKSFFRLFLAMVAGGLAIYAWGVTWLSFFVGDKALALGFYPFLPGCFIKTVVACLGYSGARSAVNRASTFFNS